MKLIDYAWNIVTAVSRRDYETIRLILDPDLTYPSLTGDQRGFVMKVPPPRVVKGFYTLQGLYFDQDERSWTSLWKLFKASLYHCAIHPAYSDFKSYAQWAKGKEQKAATYSVSLVEDYLATRRAVKAWPGIVGDLAYADYLSSLRVRDLDAIGDDSIRFATKLLLSLWGVGRRGKVEVEEDAEAERVATLIRDQAEWSMKDGPTPLTGALQAVYSAVTRNGSLGEVPSLPHTEAHGECNVFDSTLVGSEQSVELIAGAYKALGAKGPTPGDEKTSLDEAKEFYEVVRASESRQAKLKEEYQDLIATTRLDSVEFPKGDYSSYLRIRSSLSGPIRNIRDQLRLIKNALDETTGHESGQIDSQAAMQVVASGDVRTDVFVRMEPVNKEEAWAILVDASKSTSSFAHEVKGIATCLSEVAKELIPKHNEWGLFSFNSSLQVIKDFNEEYTTECKARIGGIVQRNSTLLPDALSACFEMLKSRLADTKILVVASDGYPVGYQGIEDNLMNTIKEISRSGVFLMGVGINSHAVEDYFAVNCVVNSPYQMMKSFVKSYLELSSLF